MKYKSNVYHKKANYGRKHIVNYHDKDLIYQNAPKGKEKVNYDKPFVLKKKRNLFKLDLGLSFKRKPKKSNYSKKKIDNRKNWSIYNPYGKRD